MQNFKKKKSFSNYKPQKKWKTHRHWNKFSKQKTEKKFRFFSSNFLKRKVYLKYYMYFYARLKKNAYVRATKVLKKPIVINWIIPFLNIFERYLFNIVFKMRLVNHTSKAKSIIKMGLIYINNKKITNLFYKVGNYEIIRAKKIKLFSLKPWNFKRWYCPYNMEVNLNARAGIVFNDISIKDINHKKVFNFIDNCFWAVFRKYN